MDDATKKEGGEARRGAHEPWWGAAYQVALSLCPGPLFLLRQTGDGIDWEWLRCKRAQVEEKVQVCAPLSRHEFLCWWFDRLTRSARGVPLGSAPRGGEEGEQGDGEEELL